MYYKVDYKELSESIRREIGDGPDYIYRSFVGLIRDQAELICKCKNRKDGNSHKYVGRSMASLEAQIDITNMYLDAWALSGKIDKDSYGRAIGIYQNWLTKNNLV